MSRLAQISCASPEHYTPSEYVEACRYVLGSIDTDPASSAQANAVVKAGLYYTAREDGRKYPWRGNVLLNSPGDKQGQLPRGFWVLACVHAHEGRGAVLWVGYSLEQLKSLQGLKMPNGRNAPHPCDFDWMICRERIKWVSGDGRPNESPTHGNFFSLLGATAAQARRFHARFASFGMTFAPGRGAR